MNITQYGYAVVDKFGSDITFGTLHGREYLKADIADAIEAGIRTDREQIARLLKEKGQPELAEAVLALPLPEIGRYDIREHEITDQMIAAAAEGLGYTGEHSLLDSGDPSEDEVGMVREYLDQEWDMDAAIHEVVRTRKYREGAP